MVTIIAVSSSCSHFERSSVRIHTLSWDQVYAAEDRIQLYGAMCALVDLPGVANPLKDDWWLLEGCASGLVMGRLSQDVRTDEVVSAITEVTGGWPALRLTSSLVICTVNGIRSRRIRWRPRCSNASLVLLTYYQPTVSSSTQIQILNKTLDRVLEF